MPDSFPDFTPLQWEFLSALEAFSEPVTIEIIGTLVPLPPGQFLDFIRKCETNDWIHQSENDLFSLSDELPSGVQLKLEKINSTVKIKEILDSLASNNLVDKLPRKVLARLLKKSGRQKKALRLEMELAVDALKLGHREIAQNHLIEINRLLKAIGEALIQETWFIGAAIKLSRYSTARLVGIKLIIPLIKKTIKIAEIKGDQRQWALANLILGKCYWHRYKVKDAIDFLSRGKEKVEDLGDRDILTQAALYIGIYYYIQGLFQKASVFFETAAKASEENEDYILNFEAPVLLSYCDVFHGEFHRAIGKLDFFRHCVLKLEDYHSAAAYRAILGIILWLINKREEALFHLEKSKTDSLALDNMPGYYLSLVGLSSLYMKEGDIDNGLALFKTMLSATDKMELVHQVYHPFFLESHFAAEQAGCKLPKRWGFNEQFELIMTKPCIHLQGAALRLRAVKSMTEGVFDDRIIKDLNASEKLLNECDDPTELAKTRIEKTRFYLNKKDLEKARGLAYEAYRGLSGYCEIFFPDDLRFLLGSKETKLNDELEQFVRILEEFISASEDVRNLDSLLSILCRFFRAERSGLFLFGGKTKKPPELKASRNLSRTIVDAEGFRESLTIIYKSFRIKKPVVVQSGKNGEIPGHLPSLSILCLPFRSENRVEGVLYFDNTYLENCFDFVESPMLKRLVNHLANFIESFVWRRQSDKAAEYPPAEASTRADRSGNPDLISGNRDLLRILSKAKRIAPSDATVLILGEKGVGKEVLAQWIHRNSRRVEHTIIVVDIAAMPETLVESELFGYEKGAFTGADRQKIGLVELAHQGTLFIDEIGEIPQNIQAKLLRLFQEKSFMRIGGTKTITSDFRLLTATNRNLKQEVASGRFREDLYYRLNLLEFSIPPLRQRPEDILLLARHFLSYYAKKYNRSKLVLTPDLETSLIEYDWPGNVRELKNVIERAVLIAEEDCVEFNFPLRQGSFIDDPFSDLPTMNEMQRRYLNYVFKKTGGLIGGPGGAAEILGMKRTTVNSRKKKLGIS